MSGRYLTDLASWFRAAGLTVVEYDGWKNRARSSGGYADGRPWGVMWHHTASNSSPQNDASYMCHGSPDRPIANIMIPRDGTVWVLAAGATNTNGKGGPWKWSRGTVPVDSMNTHAVGIEICNSGTGQEYPEIVIATAFTVSVTLCRKLGLADSDVCHHERYAPTRKVDPATAAAVQGPWKPRSTNSSGTWNLDDLISEHRRRFQGGTPTPPKPSPEPTPTPEPKPEPKPPEEDWMAKLPTIKKGDRGPYVERMQHLLAAAGFMDPANAANYDGVWGSGTDGAKQRFDAAHGLTPSPPTDCGQKSWESLMTGRKW